MAVGRDGVEGTGFPCPRFLRQLKFTAAERRNRLAAGVNPREAGYRDSQPRSGDIICMSTDSYVAAARLLGLMLNALRGFTPAAKSCRRVRG
jgi:hypothetical protein